MHAQPEVIRDTFMMRKVQCTAIRGDSGHFGGGPLLVRIVFSLVHLHHYRHHQAEHRGTEETSNLA